jgi:transcriptional regulator with XRE-family HTH domain
MCARMATRPRQVTVWYRGIPYTLDLVRCRRALVERQVEGELSSMESLAGAVGVSRSTASRFFSGRPTSLTVTLRMLKVLRLRFEDVARPETGDQDDPEGRSSAANGSRRAPRSPQPGVGSLGLSVRAANCLLANDVTTVDQVLDMTDDELLSLRNLGREALEEIREKLVERGFVARDRPESASR